MQVGDMYVSNSEPIIEDAIKHPAHYGGEHNPCEAIKVIEAWKLNFNLGNVAKYLSRAGKKPGADTIRDLEKARFYLSREIETLVGNLDR